jgi:putative transposase
MPFDPTIHHRKSIRLRDYDYAQAGWYFITICTHQRQLLFGEIVAGSMVLNAAGLMVKKCWDEMPQHFPQVTLDEFVVMPDHVHGIIVIGTNVTVGAKNLLPLRLPLHLPLPHGTSKTVGSIVRGFKIGVTKWFRVHTNIPIVWQRNYYEHIIRDETEYLQIAEYIQTNPQAP